MCYERRRAEAGVDYGTREDPGTLTQGGALFSLVPLVWESNPKLQGGWWVLHQRLTGDLIPTIRGSGAHPGRGWDP